MDRLTTAAANGLQASMDSMDMLANNIANASTAGFKADREFYSTYLAPEIGGSSETAIGESPVVQRQWTDFSQGTLVPTNNPTDLALSGSGFFVVNGPNGPLYTRNGTFQMSTGGVLTTAEGYPVQVTGGSLQAASGSPITVNTEGSVYQDGNVIGQLQIVNFTDAGRLTRANGPYFQNPDPQANPTTPSQAVVYQGKVENSNAQPAESAARMVGLLRHYEMLQRAIRLGAEMNQHAVQEVARVGP
jgi:flagellar basal body rod protein FlgG